MAEQHQARRPAHNKIPQDQDDLMMALARREVRASDAVREFLGKFPPEGEAGPQWSAAAAQRATFLYRHRLRRARAEADAAQPIVGSFVRVDAAGCVVLPYGVDGATGKVAVVRTDDPGLRSALDDAAGDTQDAALGPGGVLETIPAEGAGYAAFRACEAAVAGTVKQSTLFIPSEADPPATTPSPARALPRVGDRVRVVAGFVIGSCGVVREVVSDGPRPSIAVVFDEDVGLWFSPECLVVVGDEAPDETPSAGGMDGEVRRAERERDEARAEADSLRARVGKLDAEVAELSARLARPLLLLKPQPDLHVEALRESAAAARAVSDALQALAAQQADAVAAKDAEIATLKLHLDDLRRQAGLS